MRISSDLSNMAAGACLLVAAAIASACGGGGDDQPGVASLASTTSTQAAASATATAPADPDDAFLAFQDCLREHGAPEVFNAIPFDPSGPAPTPPPNTPTAEDLAKFEEAQKACNYLLENVTPNLSPEDQSELQDQLLAYAKCMRDHGIDFPDPQITESGTGFGVLVGGDGGVDPSDPAFQEAQKACGSEVGGGFSISPGVPAQ